MCCETYNQVKEAECKYNECRGTDSFRVVDVTHEYADF